ncbi:short-chain dehydrogenase [Marinobacter psychrophilus]|jgi:NAD(P)-dependent dehydrogenase (short-subunit alcohol dehydrogenase family)|uniref:Short-chain dehydrogenase n=1 Tax=Marinobacter psychrophilus TaxID=330734 RepID=A0A0H4I8U6_9GAMM|nr:SDR family NAD(P)-dependent oxidoreductase [Marinobacter psychrophilus]AKO54173.1 short-chain dehydrogenase [Marinobacter psychrophilus]
MRILIAGVSGAIGAALAEKLGARADVEIIGLCRQPGKAPAFLHEQHQVLAWDAEKPEALGQVAAELAATVPKAEGLDMIIYAAGILHGENMKPEKRLEDLQASSLVRAMAVNASGFGLLVQALLPWLRHKRTKRIVAISAKVGGIGDNRLGGWYAYRSSKAALNMLVKTLSVELPRRMSPVVCIALHPGTTHSALSEPFSQSLANLEVHDPCETAANLLTVIDHIDESMNGSFLSWDGNILPW